MNTISLSFALLRFGIILGGIIISPTAWSRVDVFFPKPPLEQILSFTEFPTAPGVLFDGIESDSENPNKPALWNEYANRFLQVLFVIGMAIVVTSLSVQNRNLRQTNKRLEIEESRYRSIAEDQQEIICRFRKDLSISYLNEAYCHFLGKKREELLSESIPNLIREEDHSLFFQSIATLTPSKPSLIFENKQTRADGTVCWYSWILRAFFENGTAIEYQATGRDITELKNALQALIRTKEDAEHANRAKSDFLARMSHELRTPLNSVIGFASILIKNKENNLDGREINFLSRILANGKHLLELINQVLDLSKIESGRMDFHWSSVTLSRLLEEILNQLEDQIRAKTIEFRTEIPPTVASIKTDEGKLKQILINLIGNSIKFTERGYVLVRIVVHERTRIPYRIDIIDTGVGIPADRLALVFEPFQQADTGASRPYEGTGLGLSISKSLCELLGYRIEVESRLGEGSCFRLYLNPAFPPITDWEGEPQESVPVESPLRGTQMNISSDSILAGKTVLIIDDDPDSRILLQNAVEEFGCRAYSATSGQEGLAEAGRVHPDIILMDVLMPEMNGWEVLINLKSDPVLSLIPVVIVSVVASELKSVSLGLVDLVDKPFNPRTLHDVLVHNLRKSRGCVLLFCEEPENRNRMAAWLEDERFDVCCAENHQEAQQVLESGLLDLIAIDLSLPGEKGKLFLEILRRDSKYDSIPIVGTIDREDESEWIRENNLPSHLVYKGENLEKEFKKALSIVRT